MSAKLKVRETNSNAARYHYRIVDTTTGSIIKERRSKHKYVAVVFDNSNYHFFSKTELAESYLRLNSNKSIAYLEPA